MKKSTHPIYYIAVILYLELLLRFRLDFSSSWGLFFVTGYSMFYGLMVYLLEGWLKEAWRSKYRFTMTLLGCAVFAAQFIYYTIFKTFFTLYSVSKSGQIVEFLPDVIYILKLHLPIFLLFFVPLIFLLRPLVRLYTTEKQVPKNLAFALIVLIFLMNTIVLTVSTQSTNNPKDMFFRNRELVNGIRQLGMLTTMRLDLQRMTPLDSYRLVMPPSRQEVPYEEASERDPQAKRYPFAKLAEAEQDLTLKDMHTYFASKASSNKNSMTGRLKDYNVITITAESFSPLAVNQKLTPTLYKLVQEGLQFTNFYNPLWGVSTIDGEYANLTGWMPVAGMWALYESKENLMPISLPFQLQDKGYTSYFFHNHLFNYYRRDLINPNLGYIYMARGNGLDISEAWPESDIELFEKSIPFFVDEEPFHVNYLTVSGHMMYRFNGNDMADKNRALVEHLDQPTEVQAYLAGMIELDRGLEILLRELRERELLERTLIVIAADHYPYAMDAQVYAKSMGVKFEKKSDLYRSTLIMYAPGLQGVVEKPMANVDILPTVLNLLGEEFDSRLYMGSDVFSDSLPLVIFQDRSFVTEYGFYDAVSHRYHPKYNKSISKQELTSMRTEVDRRFYYSEQVIRRDYFRSIEEYLEPTRQ